uniref:Uncharacterized protein n=1 Tax=Cyprinodon variegatus TaxID=28743 RepID=A0A3Q2GIQ1_CYPVA
MAATDHSRSEAAKQRRQDQLQRWLGSETDRTGSEGRKSTGGSGTRRAKVQFAQGAVFMAACSAGDREEVAALLRQGADINHANVDGLTALHQVGKVLLQCRVDVDCRDVDGWTPLHAAAHWGQEEVCTLLADHMCDMAAVNNVGQTPLDVADENLVDALEELQKKQNAVSLP